MAMMVVVVVLVVVVVMMIAITINSKCYFSTQNGIICIKYWTHIRIAISISLKIFNVNT
jgi:hypothetical protein